MLIYAILLPYNVGVLHLMLIIILGGGLPTVRFTGLPYVLFTCVSHIDAEGVPLLGTSLDQWQFNFLTRHSVCWREGRFPTNSTTNQLRDQGDTIYAKFQSIRGNPPAPISYEYANNINIDMFKPPDPLPQQFGFLCSNENGRAFSGRPRGASPTSGLEALQMFQEMCRCWKCRYLHHYSTAGSSDLEAMPTIKRESYVQTSLNCNPPLKCAEDIVQSQCATLRLTGTMQPAIAEQPVDID